MHTHKIFVLLFLTSPSPRVERGKKVFWSVKSRQVGIYDLKTQNSCFSLTWNLLSAGMNRMVHTAGSRYAGKRKKLLYGSLKGHQPFKLTNFVTMDSLAGFILTSSRGTQSEGRDSP